MTKSNFKNVLVLLIQTDYKPRQITSYRTNEWKIDFFGRISELIKASELNT